MTRLLKLVTLALLMMTAASAWAQPPRGKVLAFFTTGGETDHYLFAQDAMRRLGANAATQGYSFATTSDWDALSDAGLNLAFTHTRVYKVRRSGESARGVHPIASAQATAAVSAACPA